MILFDATASLAYADMKDEPIDICFGEGVDAAGRTP
jgi:hypothetical protein